MSPTPLLYSSGENSLQIRVCTEKIIYSVHDGDDQVILRQEINMIPGVSANSSIYEHYFNQPELKIPGDQVHIVFENSRYQLVPSELYRSESKELLFYTEFEHDDSERLCKTILPRWGAHFVFGVPVHLYNFFQEKYPEATNEHHVSFFMKKMRITPENKLFALVRNGAIDLMLIQNQNLVLLSSPEVSGKEDAVYFILNLFEQLNLDVASFPVALIFQHQADQELAEQLRSFIKNVTHLS